MCFTQTHIAHHEHIFYYHYLCPSLRSHMHTNSCRIGLNKIIRWHFTWCLFLFHFDFYSLFLLSIHRRIATKNSTEIENKLLKMWKLKNNIAVIALCRKLSLCHATQEEADTRRKKTAMCIGKLRVEKK